MTLGRTAPRYQEMAVLYPRSQHLQNALFEYYIVVIDMCCEIIKLSKSTITRYWTTFSKESYTHRLDRYASTIMNEVHLENARVVKAESSKMERIKALSRRQLELQKSHQSQVLKKRLLEACSTHDYQTTWKQARKLGTTLLFHDSNTYLQWKQSRTACTLVYSGALGSGKTVLLANIVDDLYLQQDSMTRVVYFFCRYDLPTSMTARTILGCLARQLIQDYTDMNALVKDIELDNPLTIEDISALIKKVGMIPIHFVLDGFDDCSSVAQQDIVSSLQNLQTSIPLLTCIATRVQGDIFIDTDALSIDYLSAHIPIPNPDVDVYITNEVNEQLRLGNLIVRDDRLVEIIQHTLQSQASGMFLWARLQIVCLTCMENDHDIQEALKDLPDGLSETYCRLLKLHDKSRYRRLLFELIIAALQPLTLTQLEHAISVEPGNTQYNPAKVLNSIDKVIRSCAGMIFVDEEEETARFVHHSAHQFLISPVYDKQIDQHKAQTTVAEIVLTYLNYTLFETQIAIRRPTTGLTIKKLPAAMLMDMIPLSSKLLQRSKFGTYRSSKPDPARSAPISSAEFKGYAEAYWDIHLMCVEPSTLSMKMLSEALTKQRLNMHIVHDLLTPLERAITNGRTEAMSIFLKHGFRPRDTKRAFKCAAQLDDTDVIDVLVKHSLDCGTQYLLTEAIINDCPVMWKALLDHDPALTQQAPAETFDLNATYDDMRRFTPLMFTIDSGSTRMTEALLKYPDIDRWKTSEASQLTPLAFAVARGSLRAVRLLASVSAFMKGRHSKSLWDTALKAFEQATGTERSAEQFKIIQSLVENGWYSPRTALEHNINMDSNERTLLMVATESGFASVVEVLLDYDDSNVNARWIVPEPERKRGRTWWYCTTAWDLARTPEIRSLLEQHGGKASEQLENHFYGAYTNDES